MFSTDSQESDYFIMNEHLKSQFDGASGKFKLSYQNGSIYITKPLLSKNKGLDGRADVNGFLTLQIDEKLVNTPDIIFIDG